MAIAYDIHQSTWSAGNVDSLTTASFTIGGANRYLVAGVCSGASSPVDPTEARWGGSGGTLMTKEGATLSFATFFKSSMYRLLAPTAQTSTLFALWPSIQDETALGGISFTGVDQTTPTGTKATATGSSATATVNATTVADDMVVDVTWTSSANSTLTVGANQTSRVEIETPDLGGFEMLGMSHETATGTTTTMSWTLSATLDWSIHALPLKPTTGAVYGARLSNFAAQPMLRGPF